MAERSSRSVRTWKSQLGTAAVELHVSEPVAAELVDAAVAGVRAGQLLVVGAFGELVDELGRGCVADAVAGIGCGGASAMAMCAGSPDTGTSAAACPGADLPFVVHSGGNGVERGKISVSVPPPGRVRPQSATILRSAYRPSGSAHWRQRSRHGRCHRASVTGNLAGIPFLDVSSVRVAVWTVRVPGLSEILCVMSGVARIAGM